MIPASLIGQRQVARYFLTRGAVRKANAAVYVPRLFPQKRAFEIYKDAGVLRSAGGGAWYLDQHAYSEWRRDQRKRGFLLMGTLLFAGAAMAMIR